MAAPEGLNFGIGGPAVEKGGSIGTHGAEAGLLAADVGGLSSLEVRGGHGPPQLGMSMM